MTRKEEFIRNLKAIDFAQSPEFIFENIYDLTWNYQNDAQKWNLDIAFDKYLSAEAANDKFTDRVIDLEEAWYYVSSIDHLANWYRLTEYGLVNLDKEDLKLLVADIIERVEKEDEEN